MITIVPYAAEHQQQVIEVILPIQQCEFEVPITLAKQPDLLDIPAFYQTRQGNFWVALADGRVVGTIALVDLGDGLGALRKMFVSEAYRGSQFGTAKMLLDTLLVWAKTHGFREIYLGTTDKFLAAHRFYEKNGFDEVAVESLPQAFPRMDVDSKFYRIAVS